MIHLLLVSKKKLNTKKYTMITKRKDNTIEQYKIKINNELLRIIEKKWIKKLNYKRSVKKINDSLF